MISKSPSHYFWDLAGGQRQIRYSGSLWGLAAPRQGGGYSSLQDAGCSGCSREGARLGAGSALLASSQWALMLQLFHFYSPR